MGWEEKRASGPSGLHGGHPATTEWRGSLRPLTKELIAHKIPYHWGATRSLIIPKENGDLKITNVAEIPDTLQTLGLPSQAAAVLSQPTPSTSTHRDPARVCPFVPVAHQGDPLSTLGS
ncbi:Hypothetical predicted protein [Pelobates cultripes]|uniref:Uncharacterized protein n=1 Tax=Pelobates cultripes TaxID=61616 RepID=A0AAD1S7C2_PELCU|nr:Hypothetical predicted protein [Pelobates cultripes]